MTMSLQRTAVDAEGLGETEDIALLKEIVANDAYVCQRGKLPDLRRLLALLMRATRFPGTRTASIATTGTSICLRISKGGPSARISKWNRGGIWERDQLLADIQSAVNDSEERGRTEREESAKRDERLADSSRALSGDDLRVSSFLPSVTWCSSYCI
jgi:hypothetical protein